MKIATLQRQASACTTRRGHRLRWGKIFQRFGGEGQTGECIRCERWVQILTKPQPNEIDVGGPALAINCDKK